MSGNVSAEQAKEWATFAYYMLEQSMIYWSATLPDSACCQISLDIT